jgi:hypothetical protein
MLEELLEPAAQAVEETQGLLIPVPLDQTELEIQAVVAVLDLRVLELLETAVQAALAL